MKRADFHILRGPQAEQILRYTAALLRKAHDSGLSTWIACENPAQAGSLDAVIWSYRPEIFIPHALHVEANGEPVQLGSGFATGFEMLLNLSGEYPPEPEQYARIAEIVVDSDNALDNARKRYRQYRQQGFQMNMYDKDKEK